MLTCESHGPLKVPRVIECASLEPVPFCGMLLADIGAEAAVRLGESGIVLGSDAGETALGPIDQIVFASERHSHRELSEITKINGVESYIIGRTVDLNCEDGGMFFSTTAPTYDIARRL